jgi:FtsH-binding integral membrane protein
MMALLAMLLKLQATPSFWMYIVVLVLLVVLLFMRRKARKAKAKS